MNVMPGGSDALEVSAVKVPADSRGSVLLLQGPVGPFFKSLTETLENQGFSVLHAVFNAADLSNASLSHCRVFRGDRDGWPDWFAELVTTNRISIVVLFGCERFQHATAINFCKQAGIPVLCLEEGYIRPGFVTAEWGGNNRKSPQRHLATSSLLEAKKPAGVSPVDCKSFNKMVWQGFKYYIIRALGRPYFGSAMYHKKRPVIPEAVMWVRNLVRKVTRRSYNAGIVEKLRTEAAKRYFLIPLQVGDDLQLVRAGNGWTNERFIRESIASFARFAPADMSLAFKVHPMERGHSNAFTLVRQVAGIHGIKDRILVFDDGPVAELVRNSCGVLTINSTTGLSALHNEIPLGVLGEALFSRDDLVTPIKNKDDLASFWQRPQTCDRKVSEGFRNSLLRHALLPGDFYAANVREETCMRITARIVDLKLHS